VARAEIVLEIEAFPLGMVDLVIRVLSAVAVAVAEGEGSTEAAPAAAAREALRVWADPGAVARGAAVVDAVDKRFLTDRRYI